MRNTIVLEKGWELFRKNINNEGVGEKIEKGQTLLKNGVKSGI